MGLGVPKAPLYKNYCEGLPLLYHTPISHARHSTSTLTHHNKMDLKGDKFVEAHPAELNFQRTFPNFVF